MESNGFYGANSTAEVPEKILGMIKNAWIAALVSAGITFLLVLAAIFGKPILGISAWELIDVALILGLAFGIYKKSRACAVIMLVYFIFAKIFLTVSTGTITGLPMALVFIYFYWQGVAGTFAYHKWKKENVVAPVSI
jgi:serine/threonine-protein kinase